MLEKEITNGGKARINPVVLKWNWRYRYNSMVYNVDKYGNMDVSVYIHTKTYTVYMHTFLHYSSVF